MGRAMPSRFDIRKASILVVDDSDVDARLLEAMLVGSGFRAVTITTDPLAACELYREHRHDLVILDLVMPTLDGFELMARLQQVDASVYVPLLAVTADPGHMERALAAGARDFISKPLRMPEVLARVGNMLEVSLMVKELDGRSRELERKLDLRAADLRESEELFRLFAANLPEGIFIRGLEEHTYRFLNPAFQRLIGRGVEVGGPIAEALGAIHSDERSQVIDEIRRNPAGGMDREVRFVHPDGTERWAHVRTFPIANGEGRNAGIGGILEDITKRRATEEALRETVSHFRALVEQSVAGIYVVEDGRFTYANPRLCEILGYPLAEICGMETQRVIVEEDRERALETRRRALAGDSAALAAGYRLRRKDGSVVHLRVEARLVTLDRRQVLLGIGLDVTESALAAQALRESEEKYRLLWETSSDAVLLFGDGGRIEYANHSVHDIFGYTPAEVEGRDIAMLQPADLRESHRRGMRRYLASGERTVDWRGLETRGIHRDGHEVPLEISFSHIAAGGRSIFAAFIRDITQRKAAHEALESANRRLSVLSQRVLDIQEEERRGIARELHDDVGQSLVALKMGLHTLAERGRDADTAVLAHCVAVADDVSEKLHELSVRLLPPQLEQLGLQDALRWLVHSQGALTGLKIGCRFGLESRRYPPETESACFRICQEALTNASQHSRAPEIVIELDAEGEALILVVRDDGVGFDEGRERRVGGRLGLLGMEERARLAGGSLAIHSAPGRGTRIVATLPFARGAADARVPRIPERIQ
jgi:PAS domain S-box-containing protein